MRAGIRWRRLPKLWNVRPREIGCPQEEKEISLVVHLDRHCGDCVIGALGGGDESGPTDPSGQQPESQQDAAPDEGESVESIAPAESEPPASNLTTGQKDALEQAASYLSFSAFSRDGLAGQLEYEGFTAEEAAFAADNCGADWNEQALLQAQSYLNMTSFSYTGLVDQLTYEGFTSEQAVYGADHCGADWNEQAALKAASYLDMSAFSREGLIDQLEYEGFTHDQAVYGVTQNGY